MLVDKYPIHVELKTEETRYGNLSFLLTLCLSAVLHLFLIWVTTSTKVTHDLAAANKPEISILLLAAEPGHLKSSIVSTQRRGSLSDAKTNKKLSVKPASVKKTAPKSLIHMTPSSNRKLISKKNKIRKHRAIVKPVHSRLSSTKQLNKQQNYSSTKTHRSKNSVRSGDRPPSYQLGSAQNPQPRYPYLARERGWEGRVVLRVQVNKQGYAEKVSVQKASGHPILDRAAKSAIKKWRFRPSLKSGQKVAATIPVPIRFMLF